jgi:hypothetical protein
MIRNSIAMFMDGGPVRSPSSTTSEEPSKCREQDSPDTLGADLSLESFLSQWSAGKPTACSQSPSPLDLSLQRPDTPPLWPSPATDVGKNGGSPGSVGQNEGFSPIRIDVAVRQAMADKISSRYKLSSRTNFSTSLPDPLRNVGQRLTVVNAELQSFSSSDDEEDGLETYVPRLDVKSLPEFRKQALLVKFKMLVQELEGDDEVPDQESEEFQTVVPTPPPRPSAVPRNRALNPDRKTEDPNVFSNFVFPSSLGKDKAAGQASAAACGLYGAENVDLDYWQGFDQAYDVQEKSFDSVINDEQMVVEQWNKSVGKWVEKGVNVMKPLDEESTESNSPDSKASPLSKKGVHWKDDVSTEL